VEFEERIHLADILDDRWTVVGRIQLSWCRFCGESLSKGEGEICPTCDKRRVGAWLAGGRP
jgi:hypothetical protein